MDTFDTASIGKYLNGSIVSLVEEILGIYAGVEDIPEVKLGKVSFETVNESLLATSDKEAMCEAVHLAGQIHAFESFAKDFGIKLTPKAKSLLGWSRLCLW